MNIQDMLRVTRRHTLEVIFQVMRLVVNYRKGRKQLKNALYLESSMDRPPIYNRLYLEKPLTASPGNPVGATKSSSHLLFVQPVKKSTSLKEIYFWRLSEKQIYEKNSHGVEICL